MKFILYISLLYIQVSSKKNEVENYSWLTSKDWKYWIWFFFGACLFQNSWKMSSESRIRNWRSILSNQTFFILNDFAQPKFRIIYLKNITFFSRIMDGKTTTSIYWYCNNINLTKKTEVGIIINQEVSFSLLTF